MLRTKEADWGATLLHPPRGCASRQAAALTRHHLSSHEHHQSKQRVAAHGEVFTPAWLVEAMLDLVREETERIDAGFLEPACGNGNFLVQILRRKLAAMERMIHPNR